MEMDEQVDLWQSEGSYDSSGRFTMLVKAAASRYSTLLKEIPDIHFFWLLQAGYRWGIRGSLSQPGSLTVNLKSRQSGLTDFLASLGTTDSHSHPAFQKLSQALLAAQTAASEVTLSMGSLLVCRIHNGRMQARQDKTFDAFDSLTLTLKSPQACAKALSSPIHRERLRHVPWHGEYGRPQHSDLSTPRALLFEPAVEEEQLACSFRTFEAGEFIAPGQPRVTLGKGGRMLRCWLKPAIPGPKNYHGVVVYETMEGEDPAELHRLPETGDLVIDDRTSLYQARPLLVRSLAEFDVDPYKPGKLIPVYLGITLKPLPLNVPGLTLTVACPPDIAADFSGLRLVAPGDWADQVLQRLRQAVLVLEENYPMETGFLLRRLTPAK